MAGKSASEKAELQIEAMQAGDVVEVAEIERICGLSYWGEQAYLEEFANENSLMLVAKLKNEVVGFLLARLIIPEGELLNIGVLPRHQNSGIGQLLLNQILREFKNRGVREVFLEVRQSNQRARGFYQKNNFMVIGDRKNFYTAPGEDGVSYKLELES